MRESTIQLQLKNLNRKTVLNYMRSNEFVTKAGVANVTGLTFMAIKKIIAELEMLKLVRNGDYAEHEGMGRKALSYTINEEYAYAVGVYINRFVSRAAVTDLKGRIISCVSLDTSNLLNEQEKLVEKLIEMIRRAILESSVEESKILGIGVGVPGPVNVNEGIILTPPNFQALRYLPLKEILEQRLKLPVILHKDSNVSALGEYWNGAGKEAKNLFYIELDMGIGSGMIFNGTMNVGANQMAGELGHATLCIDGPECSCGNKGCVEAMCSGYAVVRDFKEKLEGQPNHVLYLKRDEVGIEDVLLLADQKDLLALTVLNQAAFYTGVAISNMIHMFDPQVIVLGGIMVRKNSRYVNTIKSVVAERKIKGAKDNIIVESQLAKMAGVIGAAELIIDNFFDEIVNQVLSKEHDN